MTHICFQSFQFQVSKRGGRCCMYLPRVSTNIYRLRYKCSSAESEVPLQRGSAANHNTTCVILQALTTQKAPSCPPALTDCKHNGSSSGFQLLYRLIVPRNLWGQIFPLFTFWGRLKLADPAEEQTALYWKRSVSTGDLLLCIHAWYSVGLTFLSCCRHVQACNTGPLTRRGKCVVSHVLLDQSKWPITSFFLKR